MHPGGGGAADQQRNGEAFALHLLRNVGHLLQRRSDETREADDVDLLLTRLLEDLRARDHDAHVDHVEVVAREHHGDDVLADVVHVALNGGDQDLALALVTPRRSLLGLDERHEVRDRLFHHPRGLYHLRQEHLAGAEKVADDVHPVHERALDHLDRALEFLSRLLGVLDDPLRDAPHQRVAESLLHRLVAPREVFDPFPFVSPLKFSAKVTSRSVASGRRLKSTSSTRSSRSFGISSYTPSCPALTMPMVMPAFTAW